jgi:hypothetical protein
MRRAKAVLECFFRSATMAMAFLVSPVYFFLSSPRVSGLLTVDVLALVLGDLADLQLTVGGLGGAITAGQVVDDETKDVLAGAVSDGGLELGDVGNGVAILLSAHAMADPP